jgi:bifunctional DNA-binding transcriptional regulator/antitoxin component of YhaV-PrlF toxin-antitoxin module
MKFGMDIAPRSGIKKMESPIAVSRAPPPLVQSPFSDSKKETPISRVDLSRRMRQAPNMTRVAVGPQGEIALPDEVRERYGFDANTPVRIVETRSGVLLVPLNKEPMAPELQRELAEWQSLSSTVIDTFEYRE